MCPISPIRCSRRAPSLNAALPAPTVLSDTPPPEDSVLLRVFTVAGRLRQSNPIPFLPFCGEGVSTNWAMEFARWRFRQNRPNGLMTPTKLKDLAR